MQFEISATFAEKNKKKVKNLIQIVQVTEYDVNSIDVTGSCFSRGLWTAQQNDNKQQMMVKKFYSSYEFSGFWWSPSFLIRSK